MGNWIYWSFSSFGGIWSSEIWANPIFHTGQWAGWHGSEYRS